MANEYVTYEFRCVQGSDDTNRVHTRTLTMKDDGIRWDEVLEEFTQFLSGIYGYQIEHESEGYPKTYDKPEQSTFMYSTTCNTSMMDLKAGGTE